MTPVPVTAANGVQQSIAISGILLSGATYHFLILGNTETTNPVAGDTFKIGVLSTPTSGVVADGASSQSGDADGNLLTMSSTAPSIVVTAPPRTARYVDKSDSKIEVQKLVFTNSAAIPETISTISLTPSGTIDESTDVNNIQFYLDSNANGTYDSLSDTVFAMSTTTAFSANNTLQVFNFFGTPIPASGSLTLFVVYDFTGLASDFETVVQSIAGGTSDISFGSGLSAVSVVSTNTATITVDSTAPNNEDSVYAGTPSSVELGTSFAINPSSTSGSGGLASDTVWIAPSGTSSFIANGTTITSTTGSSSSITAPTTPGTYKIFVKDAAGHASSASISSLTVTTPAISFTAARTAMNTIVITFNQSVDISSPSNFSWAISGAGFPTVSSLTSGPGVTTQTITTSGITDPNAAYTATFHMGFGNIYKSGDGINFLADSTSASAVDAIAPNYQNSVFTGDVSDVAGNSVTFTAPSTIIGGDPSDTVFIAPAATVIFVANGTTITSAIGTAFNMTSPTTPGTYKFFLKDPTGNVSVASTHTLTLSTPFIVSHTASIDVKNSASNHTFTYTAPADVPVGGNLYVCFPTGFTDTGMTNGNVFQDADLLVNSSQRTLAATAGAGADGVSLATPPGSQCVVFTLDTGVSTSDAIEIRVGLNASQGGAGIHQFVNPVGAGSVNLDAGATSSDFGTNFYDYNTIAFVVVDSASAPTVILTDDNTTNFVKDVDTVHVTATFSEGMASSPTISIDNAGACADISSAVMVVGGDATVWTYDWNVPTGSGCDGASVVTVAGTSLFSVAYAGTDHDDFTVDNTAPTTPTILFPTAAGVYLIGGSSQNFTWSASMDTNFDATPIAIGYSALGDFSDTVVVSAGTANDGSYTVTLPSSNVSTAKIRITATDKSGNTATSTSANAFTIDSIAPADPVIGVVAGDDVINYAESVTGGGVTVSGTKEAGSTVSEGDLTVTNGSTTWSFLFSTSMINSTGDGAHTIDGVFAADAAGNQSGEATRPFSIDLTSPSTPTASPDAGTFTSTQSVTLSSTGSLSIHYTTNGDVPTCSSTTASGAISVSTTETLKAVGCDLAGNISSTGSFLYTINTSSGGGGGGGTGSAGGYVLPVVATVPIVSPPTTTETTQPVIPSVVPESTGPVLDPAQFEALLASLGATSNPLAYAKTKLLVVADAKSFGVTLSAEQTQATSNFIVYGISKETVKLGEGERRALMRDYYQTVGKADANWQDLQRLTIGQKPLGRNLTNEQKFAGIALRDFKKMTGHAPDFKDVNEDLAWNTLMYRIRFPRDLTLEQQGIVDFKKIFKRTPSTPFDWSEVRALGYALK
ncbi:MAG: chitobiase/beta-hexosaminidase C-terminal domain-containing protein [Candidatus Uhrbacteria bacterium]|nr:chitobiase/beta-hexosaminidase C-terminal domain-containing protein [Candidatus Uhrbacteria bacterium]